MVIRKIALLIAIETPPVERCDSFPSASSGRSIPDFALVGRFVVIRGFATVIALGQTALPGWSPAGTPRILALQTGAVLASNSHHHRGFRFRQLQILRSQTRLLCKDFHCSRPESDSVMIRKQHVWPNPAAPEYGVMYRPDV